MTETKFCPRCKEEKDIDCFWFDRTRDDGRGFYCKVCSNDLKQSNKKNYAAAMRERRAANPELVLLIAARCRAKRLGLPFDMTIEDINIPEKCPICSRVLRSGMNTTGRTSAASPSIDKWDPERGYVSDNVWIICLGCNRLKSDQSGIGLLKFAYKVFSLFGKYQEERRRDG